MKNFARALVLFCACFSEVRVHAENLISYPVKCWGHAQPCGVQNLQDEKAILKAGKSKITLAPHATIQQITPSSFRLISGKIMVEAGKDTQWNSLFADVTCADKCYLILEREDENTRVLALEGNLRLKRLGDKTSYNVPQGFWVRTGNVEADGKGIMDFAQSLPLQPTLKEIAELYDGPYSQFQVEAYRLAPIWTKAVEVASQWHIEYAKRTIASYEAEQARLLAERLKREREDSHLRDIFKERNYFNQ
jgi:hypothetical protein